MLPLRYSLRNLWRRRVFSAMTALGIALVVTVFVLAVALARSIQRTVVSTGDPQNLIVMRASANSEMFSITDQEQYELLRYLDGVEAAARTLVAQVVLHRRDGTTGMVLVRGLDAARAKVRPEFRVVEGRVVSRGANEVMLGRALSGRYAGAELGDVLHLGRRDFRIVGLFTAGGTAAESEIWGDLDPLLSSYAREVPSTILLRVRAGTDVQAVRRRVIDNPRLLGVQAVPEPAYYADQVRGLGASQAAGLLVALLLALGAVFGAMNTLDGAVASRTTEIAVLRALGYSRGAVMGAFLVEGTLLGALGGVLGSLGALPVSGITTASTNFLSFSEIGYTVRVGIVEVAGGLLFSLIIGLVGGLVPARAASRVPPALALRA
jgi:putative ABC transport system permease protein